MSELEHKLSYESGQVRFGGQSRTWGMRDKASGQHFEHTEKSVRSDSSEEKLRAVDRQIQKSDEKLEKLQRRKGAVRTDYIRVGTAQVRLKERSVPKRLSSRETSRLSQRERPGPVKVRFREAELKDYQKEHSRKRKRENRAYIKGRLLFREAEKALSEESLKEDETDVFPDAVRTARNGGRLLYMGSLRMTHKLLEKNSVYRRFDAEAQRNARLKEQRGRLSSQRAGKEESERGEAVRQENAREKSASQFYKERRKKQQVAEHHRQSQGSFGRKVSEAGRKVKKVRERAGRTKRILAGMFSGIGIALLLAGAILILLIALLALISAGSSIGASFLSMNDYGTMTEGTNFFNDKCTDLYMYLNIDRDQHIEPDLRAQFGVDIYEFIYDVDKPITYDQIDLIAYLSAKYGSFTLSMTETEMTEIFEQMFVVEAKVEVEPREVRDPDTGEMILEDQYICYVTLKTTGFDEVIVGRLTDGEKNSYLGYRLSSCGQQVMNPVLEEDWTDLISSPFGSRYHPIHHEYRMHEGVDIAVPEGTKVYAAVSGTVTAARYSDSAGYMVSITDDNGFTVTYMHLSSYAVAAGQKITAGQMVALSGNTGNSTGPHLHLAVQDAEGNYFNPVFMIPQTCVNQNEGP